MENTTTALQYLVRPPQIKSEKIPLIILLHGVGDNEKNMFSMASALPDKFLVVSARGPFVLGQGSYAWFQVQFTPDGPKINAEQAEKARQLILQFIDELKTVEIFDAEQVFLLGFSQGGIMSYSVALTEPEKVKGAAVMSSRLLPEVRPLIAAAERLKQLHLFVAHGTEDQVLTFQYAVEATSYLHSKGMQPEFHHYKEGHTISAAMLQDVVEWLNKQ